MCKICEQDTEKKKLLIEKKKKKRSRSCRPGPLVHCCFSVVSEGSGLSGQAAEINTRI